MNDLVQSLVSTIGVSQDQAEGGAGLLLQLVKDKLATSEFSKVAAAVPGIESLLDAAPDSGGGGVLGALAGMLPGLGGGQVGDLAGLAAGFSKLGLDTDMIAKFAPIVIEFINNQGGEGVANLVKKALGQ